MNATLTAKQVNHWCDLCNAVEKGQSQLIGDAWVGAKHLKKVEA